MDSPDAIPSRDDDVVLSKYLREILRQSAERRLRAACDVASPPDGRDEVIEAVHLVDAFDEERVTVGVVRSLISSAIEWQEGEVARADTPAIVAQAERARSTVRELVELRAALERPTPSPRGDDDGVEVSR